MKLHQLVDLFDRADTTLWTFTGTAFAPASVTAGRLRLVSDLDPDVTRATSVAAYDLTDSRLQLETVQNAGSGVSHELRVSLYLDTPTGGNAVEWLVSVGFGMEAAVWVAGVRTIIGSTVTYDAFSYRWLRIREDAGTVYWEASPDGLEWATLYSWVSTLVLTAVSVHLGASYWAPGDVSGSWLLDNVGVDPGAGDPVTVTGDDGLPYLAVDVQPDAAAGIFTLDSSQLDGPDVLAWANVDPGAWLNVVCDVQRVAFRRGAARLQGVLTQTEAGTGSITVSDTSGTFDPMTNGDVIHKGTPLRVRAWGTDAMGARWDVVLFTCEVDELFVRYLAEDAPAVTLTVVDLVGPLAAWQSTGEVIPVGGGEDLRQRALRVLDTVGRGTLSPHGDLQFTATLAATPLERPWQELQAAVEAELGRLWVDRYNRLVATSRNSLLSGPVRGTLSDVHGETTHGPHCCVADAAVVYGVELMANRGIGSRRLQPAEVTAAPVFQTDDEVSQLRYGLGALDRRGRLELQTDGQAEAWTAAAIASSSRPELRVDSVQPAPPPGDLDTALAAWPAVLATDLGDRWAFLFHPVYGPTVVTTVGVLGIELEATPENWSVTWTTAEAPAAGTPATGGLFVLDTSQLDGTDLLTRQPAIPGL